MDTNEVQPDPAPQHAGEGQPEKPKQQRWRWVLAVTLLLAGGFGWWVSRPITLPQEWLLNKLPGTPQVAIDIRDAAGVWDVVQHRWRRHLEAAPAYQTLIRIAAQHGVDLHPREYDEAALQIETMLAKPRDWRLVERSARGAAAVGIYDDAGNDIAMVAVTDRLARMLIGSAIWFAGETDAETHVRYLHRIRWDGEWFLGLVGENLLLATTPERFRVLCQHVKTSGGNSLAEQVPQPRDWSAPALLIAGEPSEVVRAKLEERIGVRAAVLERGAVLVELEQTGAAVRVTLGLDLNPAWTKPLVEKAARTGRASNYEDILGAPAAAVSLSGWLHPQVAWQGASRLIWEEQERPVRGVNQPFSVLGWDFLDQAVVQHASGGFSIVIHPFDASGVDLSKKPYLKVDEALALSPPAPQTECVWTLRGGTTMQAQQDFRFHLNELVELYRAPGGPSLYQQVREETRLVDGAVPGTGAIEIHPLLFNFLAPQWTIDDTHGYFATAAVTPEKRLRPWILTGCEAFSSLGSGCESLPEGAILADLRFRWNFVGKDDQVREQGIGFLENKLIRHGFVPKKTESAVVAGLEMLDAALRTWPIGRADVKWGSPQAQVRVSLNSLTVVLELE